MIRINLGLQGGGAHGAFTWGVLDRLLDEEDIEIAAISGTSAGAMNAAAYKAGLVAGGRAGARETLDWFWEQVGAVNAPWVQDWLAALAPSIAGMAAILEVSPGYRAFDAMSRMTSPYVFGALMRNPLDKILANMRFEDICSDAGPALFVGATNVRTGKIRVFSGAEITTDALMASSCLPTLFRAVEIHDPTTGRVEAFWDGGYTGNPALFPLYAKDLPDDIVIVGINPIVRDAVPDTPEAIANRINEIGFNTSLLRELRSIDFVRRLLAENRIPAGTMKRVLVHFVEDDALMNDLNVATKTIPVPIILARLKAAGREAADAFLRAHKHDIGKRDTVDVNALFS
ncbi:NTE family protein [Loktanella fryxellensis]|uniref:NTE family protein n=1 Tax=Loktanella fryxellensis TaxID=245187 RepID=A0A1H7Y808_9RHOB|nr:patatin-like phospholipase family protein [Loktanella fryxellensis]SEM41329.1 NTE family protein [Loktanella fryxellensis]